MQQRAIEEVQALDINNPLSSKAIDLLANLKTEIALDAVVTLNHKIMEAAQD